MRQHEQAGDSTRHAAFKAAVCLCGLASLGAGILDLVWGEFEPVHQPIGALGDTIPGRWILAHIAAVWLIAGGAAVIWRRTARAGAVAIALIYLVFGLFWLPRFYSAPHLLGPSVGLFIGLLDGMFTQLIVVAGALIVYAAWAQENSWWPRHSATLARWTFGLGSVIFGLGHLTSLESVARMVPAWMPWGGSFWVVSSGIAFLLAGAAFLSGTLSALAARLLALMVLLFEPLVLIPLVIAHPQSHAAWGANAYNLAAVGAIGIFAASLEESR